MRNSITAKEYRIHCLEEKLPSHKGEKIFLYGTGANAKAVLDHFDEEYHFAGLIDPEKTGEVLFGKLVYSLEETDPEMIMITANVLSAEQIYQRINEYCRKHKILLWDMYGCDEILLHDEFYQTKYLNLDGWKKLTDKYDVISFVTADVFMSRDLFWEAKLNIRPMFKMLYPYLMQQGKTVIFTNNTEYSLPIQRKALEEAGYDLNEQFYIYNEEDCEHFYRRIQEKYTGKKILHIGNHEFIDGVIPRLYGIDTHKIAYSNEPGSKETKDHLPADHIPEHVPEKAEILRKIDEAEVISFDVFDTLLVRSVSAPEDVYELTARKCGLDVSRFVRIRKDAMQAHIHENIEEIYREIGKMYPLSEELCIKAKDTELQIEAQVLTGRESVVFLFNYALSGNKPVYLISDMYLPEAFLSDLLNKKGICGYQKLIVSCEYGMLKYEGLFEVLKSLEGDRKYLHFGDHYEHDITMAEGTGISAVYLPSVKDMALHNGWTSCIQQAETINERILLGLCLRERYQDVFREEGTSVRRYAACALTPLLLGFMTWLIRNVRKSTCAKLLFVSRDGYLLQKIYEQFRESYGTELPESLYFYGSRKASFIPNSFGEGWAQHMLIRAGDSTPDRILTEIYGLSPESVDVYDPELYKDSLEYLRCHAGKIEENAIQARQNYLKYMKNCGLQIGEEYIFVDLIAAGFTQNLLEKFAPFRLKGLYLARREMELEIKSEIYSYYDHYDGYLNTHYIDLERYLTSDEPSLNTFDIQGNPVFEEEFRTEEDLQEIHKVWDTILNLTEEYLKILYDMSDEIRAEFVDEVYRRNAEVHSAIRLYDSWIKREIKDNE
ncbi:MAG: hypothetical protein IKE36_11270 [Solobacterium sp.]|nr:hypothetical protein [Solobacterium sp.]